MVTREMLYKNKTLLIVYISKEESQMIETIEMIQGFKQKYTSVTTIISGEESVEKLLTKMINEYK